MIVKAELEHMFGTRVPNWLTGTSRSCCLAALVEWISEDLGDASAEVKRNLTCVSDRVKRLDRVVDDLLAYARARSSPSEAMPVELKSLIDDVLQLPPRPGAFGYAFTPTLNPS